jgi:hypothetical protein
MVDTATVNGNEVVERQLPESIHLEAVEARRIPSPGTQRDLKAQTGHTFDQLCGADADGADRLQTLIWIKLRREFPGLRWADCADVDVEVDEGMLPDPTSLVASASSPPSVDSGD